MSVSVLPLGLPRRVAGVELRRNGGRNVVVDVTRDRVHVLNDTAMALYELCDGETTPAEMVEGVCALFRARRSVVSHDVMDVLRALTDAQLLEWVEVDERGGPR